MRIYNFVALPIIALMLSFGYPYSFTSELVTTPSTVEEEVQEELEQIEVNPTVADEYARETTPTPIVTYSKVAFKGGIYYTQDKIRLTPAMESVCTCESGRQFKPDGTVVTGIINPKDIGMCQINLKYHGEAAESLGFDLYTEVGNIKYTNYLYEQQGTQPWYLSESCWGNK